MHRQILNAALIGVGLVLVASPLSGTAMAQSSIVQVAPPHVQDYWVSVSRQSSGTLVFDGYVPDDATRTAFSETDGADVSWLTLGSGAPQYYRSAVDYGLSILRRLSEGRFALRGNVVTLSGVAASSADYRLLHASAAVDLPSGLILAMAELQAPSVAEYTFAVTRQANGNTVLSGYVPTPDLESQLLVSAGTRSSSALRYASGQPQGFEKYAQTALDFAAKLSEGSVRFDGAGWIIAGTPSSPQADQAIRSDFAGSNLAVVGWGLSLANPGASSVVATPADIDGATDLSALAAAPDQSAEDLAAAVPAGGAVDTDAQRTQCMAVLAQLSSMNAITFRSGGSTLLDSAHSELDGIATALATCPDLPVHVEGHTDSDGNADLNLALSVARAEAVVEALVARGVSAARLYAIGYGASQPVAENDTAAGKAQNRRIVVKLADES